MIIKANRHNNGGKLAHYMMTGDAGKGERAELHELKGFGEAETITEAFRDLEIMAEATKAENALFHVQVRLPEHERLTRKQWEHAADRIEKRLGMSGQPRAIYFHVNNRTGEEHMHVAWSLIDAETMKAKPLPFFKFRVKALARELEKEFDITRVKNEREGPIKFAATKDEQQQAQRLGVDKDAIRNTIRACWDRSDCGRSFDDELAHEGLILAAGNRRDYLVVDHAGGIHALGKRILGVTASQVRDKLADLDRDQIPTLQQAREFMLDLPHDRMEKLKRELSDVQNQIEADREYAKRDPVREDMAWLDAVEKAAIAKEKAERRFVAPEDHMKETGVGSREKEERAKPTPAQEKHWPIMPPQPEKQSWTLFNDAAKDATHDKRMDGLRGEPAKVWKAFQQSDNAKAFAAALDDKGIAFAITTSDEAYRSHRQAEFAKAVGNKAPRFKEGEIVIVTEPRPEHRRNGQIIDPPRVHKLDQSLADKFVKALGNKQPLQGIDATLKSSNARAVQRAADREATRLEWATKPKGFIGHTLYRATRNNIKSPVAAAAMTARTIGKMFDIAGDAIESLIAPKLTPEQIYEGEKAKDRREAEADASIEFAKYTAEQSQQRQQQEQHAARDRERDRDR